MSYSADTLRSMGREERVATLPDVSGETIDSLATESRLVPEPDVDRTAIDNIEDLGRALKPLPRSQRVQVAFEWRPTDYQALVLDYPEQVDRAQVAPKAGRQVGKTEVAGIIGADHALTNRNTDVLFAAPGQDTADEMFKEFKDAFRDGPFDLATYGVKPGGDNKRKWEFETGTRAFSRTLGNVNVDANPGNRGMNPTCVLIDEAHYENDRVYTEEIEEFFITHPSYEYYLFSTPAGKSGYFYEKVEREGQRQISDAIDEPFGWYSPHWPTKISPFAQQDYIEKKRDELDSQTFAQEFLGEFAESEDAYLPHKIVRPCVVANRTCADAARRFLGIDPAEKGDDRMVVYDLDEHGITHNIWSKQTVTGPEFEGLITNLHTSNVVPEPDVGTGETPADGYEHIVIESNMAGLATDQIQELLGNVIVPVKSTRKSKGPMYKRLKRDLEAEVLELPNHRRLISELTSLQYSYTTNNHLKIEHPPNGHDDHPDALMLANAGRVGMAKQYEAKTHTETKIIRKSGMATHSKHYADEPDEDETLDTYRVG